MITEANRIAVAISAVNLLRLAEQFSAFMMAGGSTVTPGATEDLSLWARVTGRQFDAEFQKIATLLGYAVNRIPEETKVPDGWLSIDTYPKDGSEFEILYQDGSIEADVYWSDTRYCMLGAPMGSRGPGLVSTQAGNLPIDINCGITHWRPAISSPDTEGR